MYTPCELKQIQDGLDEILDGEKAAPERNRAFAEVYFSEPLKSLGEAYVFLAPIAVDHPDLFQRMLKDPRIAKFSFLGLLPSTASLIYDSAHEATMEAMNCTRKFAFRLLHPKGDFIIKAFQSEDERKVAPLADELDFGPKQYPSTRNVITEAFITGEKIGNLNGNRSRDFYRALGRRIGAIYRLLHERRMVYNDILVSEWASHLILPENAEASTMDQARMIDFGLALEVQNPRDFTDEQVFNFVRVIDQIRQQLENGLITKMALIQTYGSQVRDLPSEAFIDADFRILGTSFIELAHRIGHHNIGFVDEGFKETYYAEK